MNSIADCQIFQLPKIEDERGNLSFIEEYRHLPFKIQRAYWVYDVPGGEARPGHANKALAEFIVAISGSFKVVVADGQNEQAVVLNRSYFGLYVPSLIWRRLEDFSTNAVCLILASLPYEESDYIRDYDNFRAMRQPR